MEYHIPVVKSGRVTRNYRRLKKMDFCRKMWMFVSINGLLWTSIFKNGSIFGNMDFCGRPFLKMDPFLEMWTFVDVNFFKWIYF